MTTEPSTAAEAVRLAGNLASDLAIDLAGITDRLLQLSQTIEDLAETLESRS